MCGAAADGAFGAGCARPVDGAPHPRKRPTALPCGRCATIRDAAGCRCSPRWQLPVQTAVPAAAPWLTAPWNRPCSWRWTPRASTAWCWTRGAIPPRWTVRCSTVCCTQATPRRPRRRGGRGRKGSRPRRTLGGSGRVLPESRRAGQFCRAIAAGRVPVSGARRTQKRCAGAQAVEGRSRKR